jgi:general stress protein 26
MTQTQPDQDAIVEVTRAPRICMLTSVGEQGRLHSHPMTLQEVTDDGDVWFFVDTRSEQVGNVSSEKRVNLAFSDGSTWLSVAGHAAVREDPAKKDELWNSAVEAWFPEGKDSPHLALLHVGSDSAEYWTSPGGKPGVLLSFVKAKLTGERPDGDSGTVDLGG